MATKPTIANARWADGGAAEIDAPLSGDRDTGFVTGTDIVADHHNYELNQFYKWAQYLDEGILTGAFALASTISPTAITGANANYAPTGYATTQEMRQDLSAAATISGLAGGVAGRLLILRNLNATYDLKLLHDDGATSTAANRFSLPDAKDLYLVGVNSYAILRYDGTLSRWVVVATNGRQPKTMWVSGVAFGQSDQTDAADLSDAGFQNNDGGARSVYAPLMLPEGTRITGVAFYLTNGAVAGTRSCRLQSNDLDGTGTTVSTGTTTSTSTSVTVTLSSSLPHTMLAVPYNLSASSVGLQTGDIMNGAKVSYY